MKKRVLLMGVLAAFTVSSFGCGNADDAKRERTGRDNVTKDSVDVVTVDSVSVTPETDDVELEPVAPIDYEWAYSDKLEEIYSILCIDDYDDYDLYDTEGLTGVMEASQYLSASEACDSIGYSIVDMSGDGEPELVIANICNGGVDGTYGSEIINIFTLVDCKPVLALEGWSRNMYILLSDGGFYNAASSGVAYSASAKYYLSDDGTELICDDFCFSYEDDDNIGEIKYYHNMTGDWDPEVSNEITEDDFYAYGKSLYNDEVELELISFSKYANPSAYDTDSHMAGTVEVGWGFNMLDRFDYEREEFVLDVTDFQVGVGLVPTEDVYNFTIYTLAIQDVDADGNPLYDMTPVDGADVLNADNLYIMYIAMYGDTPSYGFSYEDANGNARFFAVGESGKDGSLYIEEL